MMPCKRLQQQLEEVAGLNAGRDAGGQLRRARRGDAVDEALDAGVPTITAGEQPASTAAAATAGAVSSAIPAAGGNPTPMCVEAGGTASRATR